MRILQILPELNVGGVETGVVDLCRELVKKGHHSFVVSNGGEMVNTLASDGSKHYKLPVNEKSLLIAIYCIFKLIRIIKDDAIDVVHARSRVPAITAFIACRITRTPLVTTCHGRYSKNILSSVMGFGKYVITPSRAIARHMMDDFGVPRERIRIISRGLDIDKFAYKAPKDAAEIKDKPKFVIGMIGRMTPLKGHEYFIRAIPSIVKKAGGRVRAVIVGDCAPNKKAYKKKLIDLVKKLGLEKRVEFTGIVRDIPKVLSEMDILVSPSIEDEAFGRVVIEAQARGVPTVATRLGGALDIIDDGKTGLLVDPQDPTAIAEAVIRLIENRPLASALSKEARKKVEDEFTLARMADETIRLYDEAANSKRILFLKLGALGDCVLSTPSLRAIKEGFPKSSVTVFTTQRCYPVFKNLPYVDDVIIHSRRIKEGIFQEVWRSASLIRKLNYDMSVDLQNNIRTHLISFLALIPLRYGHDNGKFSFLLNRRVPRLKGDIAAVEHQFEVLKLLGLDPKKRDLEMRVSKEDELYASRLLKEAWLGPEEKLIGINVAASRRWVTKNWPIENMAQLIGGIAETLGARSILLGSKDDAELASRLCRLAKGKPINYVGRTSITQLKALIEKLDCVLAMDTAVLHLAAASSVPFVALFGPTDPRRHAPPANNGGAIVIRKNITCSPCYKDTCKTIECMKKISVEEVFDAIRSTLNNPSK